MVKLWDEVYRTISPVIPMEKDLVWQGMDPLGDVSKSVGSEYKRLRDWIPARIKSVQEQITALGDPLLGRMRGGGQGVLQLPGLCRRAPLHAATSGPPVSRWPPARCPSPRSWRTPPQSPLPRRRPLQAGLASFVARAHDGAGGGHEHVPPRRSPVCLSCTWAQAASRQPVDEVTFGPPVVTRHRALPRDDT